MLCLLIFLESALIGLGGLYLFDSVVHGLALGVFAAGLSFLMRKRQFPNQKDIIALLHKEFVQLEYSFSLLLEDQKSLARLQQEKVLKAIKEKSMNLKYPINWGSLRWTFLGVIFAILLKIGAQNHSSDTQDPEALHTLLAAQKDSTTVLDIHNIEVTVTPPRYTRRRAHRTNDPNIDFLEGSSVSWKVQFSKTLSHAKLYFSNGQELSLDIEGDTGFALEKSMIQGFYWIEAISETDSFTTPYFKVEVTRDEPPTVLVTGIPAYQKLSYDEDAGFSISTSIEDDFGLTEAFVTATITKGSGESVKFREERLEFQDEVGGTSMTLSMDFRVRDFDMEPGSELYFYVSAIDNKEPKKQSSRTETFFFILEDTSALEFTLEGNLGVDLMPEYFRSQRQIIIDTEKLLATRGVTTKGAFNATSNELGFDQKSLRLKYGQFLGEEEDSGIATETEDEAENGGEQTGENVLEEFGHDHDHEEEEGQLMDKGTVPGAAEKFIEEVSHNHDDAETASFYTVSMKTKLRAALTEMWDAELYLRLFEPEKSLPYQYRALKLIKEIKNHARIYVQRIGFDTTPINEAEKRLTGKLDEVSPSDVFFQNTDSAQFQGITMALNEINILVNTNGKTPNNVKSILRKAGNELAIQAIQNPSKHLTSLSIISQLIALDSIGLEQVRDLKIVQKDFLQILPFQDPQPSKELLSRNPLTDQFKEEFLKVKSTRR